MDGNTPHNPITGTIYQGMNSATLASAADCREWATFLQWKAAGYTIKKGEHGQKIRVYPATTRKDEKTGKTEAVCTPRCYTVFNREQTTCMYDHDHTQGGCEVHD